MSALDSLLAALASLRANILRSVLTTLGIIIGVGAVIVTVAVGAGAEAQIDQVIRSLGANVFFVVPGSGRSGGARLGRGTVPTLTEDDAAAILEQVPAVLYAAPSVNGTGQAVYGNLNWATNVRGTTPDGLAARDWVLARGRTFTGEEVRAAAKVAVLGSSLARQLFGDSDPLDAVIRVERVPFRVIGLLQERGESSMGRDQDDIVFLPISTAKKRVLGGRRISGDLVSIITVKVRSAGRIAEAEREVTGLLRQRHRIPPGKPDDFAVRNFAEILQKRHESARIMSIMLAAVASIALVVGGIGIMNIMLVSVTERTREIGLRMAVGASGTAILAQFLVESVVLSLIGGGIGVLLGLASAGVIEGLVELPLQVGPGSVLLAFGFAALVGVFFGFYPARTAARLDPIEALRHE